MITRCAHCGKPIAANKTAWAAKGLMFCSEECGLAELGDEWGVVAEEVSREDYGAYALIYSTYDDTYKITTCFETVYENNLPICTRVIGFHYGPTTKSSPDNCKMQIFVVPEEA